MTNLNDKVIQLYEEWLMDFATDEISCKDQLIEASESQMYWNVFIKKLTDGEL